MSCYFPAKLFRSKAARAATELLRCWNEEPLANCVGQNRHIYRCVIWGIWSEMVSLEYKADAIHFRGYAPAPWPCVGCTTYSKSYEREFCSIPKSFVLNHDDGLAITRRLQDAEFWSMDPSDGEWGFDGFNVLMEGMNGDAYHAVYRFVPEKDAFAAFIRHVMLLNGGEEE